MSPSPAALLIPAARAAALPLGRAAALSGLPPRLCRRLLEAGHDLPLQASADAARAARRLGPGGLTRASLRPHPAVILGLCAGGMALGLLGADLGGAAWWFALGPALAWLGFLADAARLARRRGAQAARQALLAGQGLPPAAAAVEGALLALAAQALAAELPEAAEDDVLEQIVNLLDAAASPAPPLEALAEAAETLRAALAPAAPAAADHLRHAAALADRLRELPR